MRIIALAIFLFFACFAGKAQDCKYPKDATFAKEGKHTRKFVFSNAASLALAGYDPKIENRDTIYSGIDLYRCGEDTVIAEWGEIESLSATKIADTLFVKEYEGIPIGKNFARIWVPFYVHQFFFSGTVLQHLTFYKKDIKKYSREQIDQVLRQYKQLKKGSYDEIIEVADRLFWAYVSGSKEAESNLRSIEKKFGPFDGGISEEWNDISLTYEHWKKTTNKSQF